MGPLWVVPIWAAQEWAWNVFPSTNLSSAVVVGCLAASVVGVGLGEWKDGGKLAESSPEKKKE